MKIVVVSATHAFKTLLLSLMEKKKKEKKEKDFSFVLGDRCYFLPVIFLYLFLSFFFYFASHYYSASRRTITFLLRCDPFNRLRKYFSFSFFLERSIWGHRLILKPIGTDYAYDEKLRLNAIFLFFSSLRFARLSNGIRHRRSSSRSISREPQTAHAIDLLLLLPLQVYANFSLATRRLIARLYIRNLNSISLSLSPRNELLSRLLF